MRPDAGEDSRAIEWVAFASNVFNTAVPFYTDVEKVPEYFSNTTGDASTDNFYWASRMIAAMADASSSVNVTVSYVYSKNCCFSKETGR